jgi:hypothetical protein
MTGGSQEVPPHPQATTVGIMATHTSLTCNTRNNGHKAEVTRAENMGGSQDNKERCVGEATL